MQLHHVVVEKVLPYRNKQREKFKEEMMEMLFAFVFIMINLLGAFVFYTSAVQEKVMKRKLIKSEEVEWFEETSADGERRIRVETTTKVYFKEDGSNNHNPTKVTKSEYL